jgi:hypothetical protein
LSYASAVTLALIWIVWTGRSFRPVELPSKSASQTSVEAGSKDGELTPAAALPALPAENLTTLKKTVRIGELEITPLEIVVAPLELVRSIEPADYRRLESDSLVLRLKLTNISRDHAFAPLERAFVREQGSPLDRSYIATSGRTEIGLFSLAFDSEWLIQGQEFAVLKPSESVKTIIASEPGAPERMTGEMTWRVRLRIGPYRSDMIGVKFTKDEVTRTAVPNAAAPENEPGP